MKLLVGFLVPLVMLSRLFHNRHKTQSEVWVAEGSPVVYVAAVLEYEPNNEWNEAGDGVTIIRENSRILAEYAALARAEAMRTLSCAALENEIYLVADLIEASPCRNDTAESYPFKTSLDTAYECPDTGYIYYNTQVVYDRHGTVIARYRKKNLFGEYPVLPGTESDDTAIFTTDFGVTFTLQICFDIGHYHPALNNVVTRGITDVITSSAWVDMLPFLIAPAVQNGWSRGLGVNLLFSGHHFPEKGKLGSGIYRGYTDLSREYVYDPDSGNQMIVSEVETIASVSGKYRPRSSSSTASSTKVISLGSKEVRGRSLVKTPRVPTRHHYMHPKDLPSYSRAVLNHTGSGREHLILYEDLSTYSQVVLDNSESGKTQQADVCHNDGFCCTLTYPATSSLNYSLVAYSGIINSLEQYNLYIQTCTVLWCLTNDINTCSHINKGLPHNDQFGPFTVSANFSTDYVYPMFLTRNLTLVDNEEYTTSAEGPAHTMSTQEPTLNILTAGLVGRWYDHA
nr:pantetheinase-like isoform X2 [Cherax quadricarinatus]